MPDTTYPGPESIQRHVLDNGITVLVYQNETAESLFVEGLVRAGGMVDGHEKAGLASFTADMLMRGTEQLNFEAIYDEIESVGASLHFGAGRHISDFSGVALVEDADLLFSLIAGSLRQPTFPQEQIERVRGEIMTGLQIRANDTRSMAALAFRRLLYGDHPYGRSIEGYPETIERIGREDLVGFYEGYYGPGGMIITVVGGLEPADALAKVESAFGDWLCDQAPMPEAPAAERPAEIVRTNVDMPQKTQSDIVLGLPGPQRAAEDYLEASMANTILGVFGMMGRLGKNVREEQGLAYYAFSRLRGGVGPSPWYVSTGVSPDKVEQAIDSILHEIDRLRNEPLPAEDLADSQAYRTGSLPVGLETNSGLAGTITDMEFYGLGLDYLQLLPDKIQAMTPATVQAAAAKYLSTESLAIAVAGPGEAN
ncbi:MAG TPA: pitrilysin family protein [Anaerolineae bacterium]|nr:pitrilysin family protein [Anaerolineae bacterium]